MAASGYRKGGLTLIFDFTNYISPMAFWRNMKTEGSTSHFTEIEGEVLIRSKTKSSDITFTDFDLDLPHIDESQLKWININFSFFTSFSTVSHYFNSAWLFGEPFSDGRRFNFTIYFDVLTGDFRPDIDHSLSEDIIRITRFFSPHSMAVTSDGSGFPHFIGELDSECCPLFYSDGVWSSFGDQYSPNE